jgi:hypothetical protein
MSTFTFIWTLRSFHAIALGKTHAMNHAMPEGGRLQRAIHRGISHLRTQREMRRQLPARKLPRSSARPRYFLKGYLPGGGKNGLTRLLYATNASPNSSSKKRSSFLIRSLAAT